MRKLVILIALVIFFAIASPAFAINDFKRHVELDQYATGSAEAPNAATDIIGPATYASGDGVVDFLYSHKDKGVFYLNGREYNWHEELRLTNANIRVERDITDTGDANQYDQVYMKTTSNAFAYRLTFDNPAPMSDMQGQEIYLFGKKYVIQSASTDKIKFAYDPGLFVLDTDGGNKLILDDKTTLTLDGVYAQGTSNIYKAKVTVKQGYNTETKFITGGSLDTVAGVEVYVKNAIVTTSGTNQGEAQVSAGNAILALEDGGYMKDASGKETAWQASIVTSGDNLNYIEIADTQQHNAAGGSTPVLSDGGFVQTPLSGIRITYEGVSTGLAQKAGIAGIDVDFMPDSRDLDANGVSDTCLRIRATSGDFMQFLYDGAQRRSGDIWMNATDGRFYFYESSAYHLVTAPTVALGVNTAAIAWATAGGSAGTVTVTEPTLRVSSSVGTITIEYNGATSSFVDVNADGTYVNDGLTNAYIAKTSEARDYYTRYGTYVDSAGSTLVSMRIPQQQLYGLYALKLVGTSEDMPEIDRTSTAKAETVEIAKETAEASKVVTAEEPEKITGAETNASAINSLPTETATPAKNIEQTPQSWWRRMFSAIWNFIW